MSEREVGRDVTYLCRLLSQLEEPFFGVLVFPFLPQFWRQLGAEHLECPLSIQHTLERHLREVLPEKNG